MLGAVHPVPGIAAKDGFGPDLRKKLNIAAVPSGWLSRDARAPGQPVKKPSTPGVPGGLETLTPQVVPVADTSDVGAATVSGLEKVSPEARAFAKLAMMRVGFDTFMFRGRFRCVPCV